MANDFYNNNNPATELQDGTLATAVGVEEKFDEVAAGFTLVNAETVNGIALTNADVTNREISDAISERANKNLGFDSTGQLGLQVRRGTYKDNWASTTYYYQDDLVKDVYDALGYGAGSIVVANVNHTSGATLAGDTADWVLVIPGDLLTLANWSTYFTGISNGLQLSKNFVVSRPDSAYTSINVQPGLAGGSAYVQVSGEGNPAVKGRMQITDSTGDVELIRYDLNGTIETLVTLEDDGNVSINGVAPSSDSNLISKGYADILYLHNSGIANLSGTLNITAEDVVSTPRLTLKDNTGTTRARIDPDFGSTEVAIQNFNSSGIEVGAITIGATGNVSVDGGFTAEALTVVNSASGVVKAGSTLATGYGSYQVVDYIGRPVMEMSYSNNTGEAAIYKWNPATTLVESELRFESDGVVCDGKVSGDELHATNGASGTFTTSDAKTVTVVDGIITSIV